MFRDEKMDKEMCDELKAALCKYLVMYGPNDDNVGVRGIRSDAPKDVIDAYVRWYRDNHRYQNGRMRPRYLVEKEIVIDVADA